VTVADGEVCHNCGELEARGRGLCAPCAAEDRYDKFCRGLRPLGNAASDRRSKRGG